MSGPLVSWEVHLKIARNFSGIPQAYSPHIPERAW